MTIIIFQNTSEERAFHKKKRQCVIRYTNIYTYILSMQISTSVLFCVEKWESSPDSEVRVRI